MQPRQRVVYTNGRASHLLTGDPEWDAERFSTEEKGVLHGAVLPALLADGWSIVSVTPLTRQAKPEDDYGSALVVLTKTP